MRPFPPWKTAGCAWRGLSGLLKDRRSVINRLPDAPNALERFRRYKVADNVSLLLLSQPLPAASSAALCLMRSKVPPPPAPGSWGSGGDFYSPKPRPQAPPPREGTSFPIVGMREHGQEKGNILSQEMKQPHSFINSKWIL